MKELIGKVSAVFKKAFGRTPLKLRIDDILGEALELNRYTDIVNLKEETGDLLSSALMLCHEAGWDPEELVNATLTKIERRAAQYASLGRKKKVAIVGGAFNPPHVGHIGVAKVCLDAVNVFDEVWLMPCFKHMFGKKMADYEHRLEMCRLATESDLRIRVSDFERDLAGESYYLVQRLLDFYHDEYDFSLVIGLDNANSFTQWVNSEHLERLIRFVVVQRQGEKLDSSVDWYRKTPHIFIPNEGVIPNISSTKIRDWIKQRGDGQVPAIIGSDLLGNFLPARVVSYIRENGLYEWRDW